MTVAVTLSNVITIASLVSEIWLSMERHTHTHTQSLGSTVRLTKIIQCKVGRGVGIAGEAGRWGGVYNFEARRATPSTHASKTQSKSQLRKMYRLR